jgi:hypothetical protein
MLAIRGWSTSTLSCSDVESSVDWLPRLAALRTMTTRRLALRPSSCSCASTLWQF